MSTCSVNFWELGILGVTTVAPLHYKRTNWLKIQELICLQNQTFSSPGNKDSSINVTVHLVLNVTGEWVLNGTTSVPKSIPRLVLDKVRLVPVIQTLPCFE